MSEIREANLAALIDSAYEAALEPALWETFLADLADTLNAKSALLRVLDFGASPRVLSSYHHNLDEQLQSTYINGFVQQDPYLEALQRIPAGQMVRNDQLLDLDRYRDTAFYQHYMRPLDNHYIVGGFVERTDEDLRTILGAHRHSGARRFDDQEFELVRQLAPHIRRAVRLGRQMGRERRRAACAEQALESLGVATFLLDTAGGLLDTNAEGEALIREERVLKLSGGRRLGPAVQHQARAFEQAVASAARTDEGSMPATVRLNAFWPGRELLATFVPAPRQALACPGPRAAVAVYVAELNDQGGVAPDTLRHLYGLTGAEARLAVELARGAELPQLSETLAVSRETLRTQLKAVFGKTGVRRQSELIRLFSGTPWRLSGSAGSRRR